MGQQQLLLTVLTIVIVGLAVAAGITAFRDNTKKNHADDALNRNVRIAQEAINWRGRSEWHGGGGGAVGTFDGLATDGFDQLGIVADMAHTVHAIQTASGTTLEIIGISSTYPEIGAYVRVTGDKIDSTAIRWDGSISIP